MKFLAYSSGIFVFTLICGIFYNNGRRMDNKNRRIKALIENKRNELDEELEKPFVQRFLLPTYYSILKTLSRLIPKNKGNETLKLEKSLKLAGINMSTNEYNAARIMFTLSSIIVVITLSLLLPLAFPLRFLLALFGLIVSMLAPSYYLKSKIDSRQGAIKDQLPDILDLLSVTIEAGLGFDAALLKVGEYSSGPIIDEFAMVNMEIQMGRTRRDALKNFSERSSVDEVKTFVGSIIQAEQLGIPIKNVLRSQAQQLRVVRKQKAEERAMKAPVKIMIPLIIFIFPVIFIILLGPTVIKVIDQFGGK